MLSGWLAPAFHSLLWLTKVKSRFSTAQEQNPALPFAVPLPPTFAQEKYFWVPVPAPKASADILSHRKATLGEMLEPRTPSPCPPRQGRKTNKQTKTRVFYTWNRPISEDKDPALPSRAACSWTLFLHFPGHGWKNPCIEVATQHF